MTDRIKALESALREQIAFYAMDLTFKRGRVDDSEIEDIEFRRDRARAALAASKPAPDCHQPDLVTAEPAQPITVQDAARVPDDFKALLAEAMVEATRAMAKFPQPNYVISKFAEESGEVVKAAIHYAEGREARDAVVSEMRQTIAMMLRLWIEGDQVHGMAPLRAIAEGRA